MKLIINARFLTQPVSGVQRYAIECSRQIKRLHNNVLFVSPANILHADLANELGAITVGRHTGHQWEQWDLPRWLWRHQGPPLLNLANTAPLLYNNNYVTLHDLAFYHHPEWNSKQFSMAYNILLPRIARSAKHIFTVSQTVKQELTTAWRVPEQKISVTYNGLQQGMIAAAADGTFAKEKIILSVGTLNKRKNAAALVAGFLRSSICNDHVLVLAGGKSSHFAEAGLPENIGHDGRVQIVPHFTDDALIGMYRSASVIASLSLYEGFGIPVLEGLAFGCKALCSDIPVYKELYQNCAYFCSPVDTAAIAAALEHVCLHQPAPDTGTVAGLLHRYNYAAAAQTILKIMGEYQYEDRDHTRLV